MIDTPTILKATYVWDGISSQPIPEGAILVEKGLIRAVGPITEILTASNAEILEFSSSTLLPGLIDSHTHLAMDGSLENYPERMNGGIADLTLRATAMMRRDLMWGITTCRCLGDREYLDIACRRAVESGDIDGPRLLVAARGIGSPEAHGLVGYPFKGVDEIRKAIRENISAGADLTKIFITAMVKGSGNVPACFSREELRAAIDESHLSGKPVAAHCIGGPGLDWALAFGIDTLEGAYHLTREQSDHLAKSNTSLVLTPGAVLSEERVKKLPTHLGDVHLRQRDQMFESMARTIQAGMPFAVGTDGLHGKLAEDVMYLSQLGASNYQALQAATFNGARALGIEKQTGSLKPGKHADIIAVVGNPFKDLRALRNVVSVIKAGKMVYPIPHKTFAEEDFAYGLE